MEVKNYTSAINAYRYNAELSADKASSRRNKNVKRSNTDKAEFSSASKASFSDSLKAAAKNAAESSASAERINALASSIADGTYTVSAEDVADSILGF